MYEFLHAQFENPQYVTQAPIIAKFCPQNLRTTGLGYSGWMRDALEVLAYHTMVGVQGSWAHMYKRMRAVLTIRANGETSRNWCGHTWGRL